MGLTLITPPTVYPVTLARAKEHLRVDHSDEDGIIEMYLAAAVDQGERYTGLAFCDQTWELVLDEFPTHEIRIPKPPLISITSVKYDDADGNEQTIASTSYTVDMPSSTQNGYGWIVPNDDVNSGIWPTTFDAINAVRVRFRAGYIDPSSPSATYVPFLIRAATLLTMGDFFEHRTNIVIGETANLIPLPAERLLVKYMVDLGFA